ncbi:hypothetical protein Metev_2359 (plasmid) [Methanohalobium evestigatum Z-7303]|uniref:Uncharacterized protein n=1 Tax=Methanohalobium evestigatum (strain ATCC BAA-1072 / DSM 3721 / NBRC 107634 / OCM 161 / Z-7303) TaxID=644295 RepID=D7EC47_METEZ|nr:hypothetical protein [Methanohalobium evestigatum]ADI75169.1 hypothetical protein Metev_2359 [Methanohalobium evestigatum Z-7303]
MYDEHGIPDKYNIIDETEHWILYDMNQEPSPGDVSQAIDISHRQGIDIYSKHKKPGNIFKMRGPIPFILFFKG